MHKWIAHPTVVGLMVCEACNYARYPILKIKKFKPGGGCNHLVERYAYAYCYPGWRLTKSKKSIATINKWGWEVRHQCCSETLDNA